jgi:spore coat polysaccharide biosynthesis predicted glycosyltransferase SpsG
LLGPRYALLREEFRQLRKEVKLRTGQVKRLLVFFGGVDTDNYTGVAIKALTELAVKRIHVDVVIGAQHPNKKQIESACIEHQFDFHVQTNRMAELMAAADLAIGAGGSATWERCCLGLPALTVSLADNQTAIAQALDVLGAGRYVGSQETASVAVMREAILDLLQDSKQVKSFSQKAYSRVDGLGVARLCEAMSC